jgi:hypothetical protein
MVVVCLRDLAWELQCQKVSTDWNQLYLGYRRPADGCYRKLEAAHQSEFSGLKGHVAMATSNIRAGSSVAVYKSCDKSPRISKPEADRMGCDKTMC